MATTQPAGRGGRPLKIIYIMQSLHFPGGMERVLTTKVNYMTSVLGYDITIVTTDGADQEPYFQLDPSVKLKQFELNFDALWQQSFSKKVTLYLKKQKAFKRALTAYLLKEKADIVVSGLRREINFLTTVDDGSVKIGECHENRKNIRGTDKLATTNFINRQFIKWRVNDLIKKLKQLDAFVVVTKSDSETWPELNNLHVKNNPSSFEVTKLSNCTSKRAVALIRYHGVKGVDRMIKAWAKIGKRHPDWHLDLYGEGQRESFQKIVDECDMQEHITLHGPTNQVQPILQNSSLYLMTSRREAWGLAIIEAMATGVPVVSYDCPYGPRNIIIDGENGFLVPDGDIQAMTVKLDLIITDYELRKQMGTQAVKNAKRFTVEKICEEWQSLFSELLKNK